MSDDDIIARIVSDNDQDLAEAKAWLDEVDAELLLAVWRWCQTEHDDPVVEIASRLAALKLAELIVERRTNER